VWNQGKSCQAQRDRLLRPSRFHDNKAVVGNSRLHLNSELSIKQHISKTVAACFYHLRRLRQIRRRVGSEVTIRLVQALAISWLDYLSSSSHSRRGPSRRSSTMTASKCLSPEVGRCLAGVVSDLVDPSATWATRPTTPGGMGKTTE